MTVSHITHPRANMESWSLSTVILCMYLSNSLNYFIYPIIYKFKSILWDFYVILGQYFSELWPISLCMLWY